MLLLGAVVKALSSFTVQSLISEHLSLVDSLNVQRCYYGAESMLGVLDERLSHDLRPLEMADCPVSSSWLKSKSELYSNLSIRRLIICVGVTVQVKDQLTETPQRQHNLHG